MDEIQVNESLKAMPIQKMKILIIGTLGAGKTTLARALSQKTGYQYDSIDDYRIQHSDATFDGEGVAWQYFLMACSDPSPAILEFSGGGSHVYEVRDALLRSKMPTKIIWMDPPHDLCIERASNRDIIIPAPFVWDETDDAVPAIHSGILVAWERIWDAEPGFCARRMVFSRDVSSREICQKVLSFLSESI